MQAALGTTPVIAAQLASQYPPLLGALAPEAVEPCLQALQQQLLTDRAAIRRAVIKDPAILVASPDRLRQSMAELQRFGVQAPVAAALIVHHPRLARKAEGELGQRMQYLQLLTGMEPAAIMAAAPEVSFELLAASRERIESGVKRVEYVAGMEQQAAAQMVAHNPGLIAEPEAVMAAKWRLVQRLCDACPTWRAELDAASLQQRALLLGARYARLARLRFLADTAGEQQSTYSLLQAVAAEELLFQAQHPTYTPWLRS